MCITPKNVAIILLAYADFEALEIALANYSKHLNEQMSLYILQNGRDNYDCERTYRVAKRYENLYPKNIKVVDWIKPQAPYCSIKELLLSKEFDKYDYVCKVDDDVFPLRSDWFDKLIECYNVSKNRYGEDLAYVTGLVNNNPWGFNEVLDIFNLKAEYFENIAMEHLVGGFGFEPAKIVPKDAIYTGACGTIWRNPYISRWLHRQTSLKPELYIEKTQNLGFKEVDNTKRYSINVMLFRKEFWYDISDGSNDDEAMVALYCKDKNKKIVADLSDPFVHLCFFTQREENKDLLPEFRNIYEKFLKLPYPISMCPNKAYENENRLRYVESKLILPNNQSSKQIFKYLFSVGICGTHKIITILGFKIKYKRKNR